MGLMKQHWIAKDTVPVTPTMRMLAMPPAKPQAAIGCKEQRGGTSGNELE